MPALSIGSSAPSFSLKRKTATGLEEVSLASLIKGQPAVLLFFPLAFTSVCENELCSVSSGIASYAGAKVVGISVDSPFAQEAFALHKGITVPLLSDFNKDVSRAYGILDETFLPGKLGFLGVAKRSAFVVGTHGKILFSWSSDNPGDLPPFELIQAAIA